MRRNTFTPAETAACCRLLEIALREDLGELVDLKQFHSHDLTTMHCIRPGLEGTAAVVARKPGVVAGLPAAALVFESDPRVDFKRVLADGQDVQSGDVLARVHGPIASLLACERIALNFLQHLSGIATLTQQFVQAVAGLPVRILDTRKTLPGWRLLAKYAVRQGGGHNHRMGLYDGILIKDNHLAFALPQFQGSLAALLHHARQDSQHCWGNTRIEIEVDTLDQVDEVLLANPNIVLLDNMTLDQMRAAVRRRNNVAPGVLLEASGGITLQTVRGIAETGVDRISVGALTHSAPALDIALDYKS